MSARIKAAGAVLVLALLGGIASLAIALRGPGPLELAARDAAEGQRMQALSLRLAHESGDYEIEGRYDVSVERRKASESAAGVAEDCFAKAVANIERAAARLGPDSPEVLRMSAEIAFRRGHYAAAKDRLSEVIRSATGPTLAAAHRMIGVILANAGDVEGAIASLRSAVENDPEDAEAFRLLALLHIQIDSFDLARGHAETAVRLAPESAEAHLAHARTLETKLDLNGVVKAYERAVTADPERLDLVRLLENARRTLGLARDVEGARAHYEQGRARESQGRLLEAAESYRAAIVSSANFHSAHYRRGVCLAAYADRHLRGTDSRVYMSQAVEHFEAALTGWPRWEPYRFALAKALKDVGRVSEAAAMLRSVLRDNPHSGAARYELARLRAYAHEDVDGARAELARAERLGVEPDGVLLQIIAEIEERSEAPPLTEDEREMAESAVEASDEGDIYLSLGDFTSAARSFERAHDILAELPKHEFAARQGRAALSAAMAWERSGDLERALHWSRKILELNPGHRDGMENVLRLERILGK